MHFRLPAWLAAAIVLLALVGCRPVQPLPIDSTPGDAAPPNLATYTDAGGIYSVVYPADWVVIGGFVADMPFPNVAIGSNHEILELSEAAQLLPPDQIGAGLVVMPRAALAAAGIEASTPLTAALPLVLGAMSDDPAFMAQLAGAAPAAATSLANGANAARIEFEGPTEAYSITLADLGDGLLLFAPRVQALGSRNAELEAQVDAIVDSFTLTASEEQLRALSAAPGADSTADSTADSSVNTGAPPTVTFTATEYAYVAPETIPGGLTRIELANTGEQAHMLWLVKVDEGKTFGDLMAVFSNFADEPSFPTWMTWYGGVTAEPGGSAAYTVDLAQGMYLYFSMSEDENGEPDAAKGMAGTLSVTEPSATGATPPASDLRVELVEFSFLIDGEPASGPQVVEIANTGAEPHEVVLLKLAEGATVQDAMDFMMADPEANPEAGAPPFEFYGGAGPQASGLTTWYEVDIPPGEYGITCFLPSPTNDGASHLMLGMVQQVSVP
jgi:hypothetical protein